MEIIQKGIGQTLVNRFFTGKTISDLWDFCPCKMLWEAIRMINAKILTQNEVVQVLRSTANVFVFSELLPSLYQGVDPTYKVINCSSVIAENEDSYMEKFLKDLGMFGIEPIYIVSQDFTWMIVLTTENTADGKQLCAYTEGPSKVFKK